MHIFETFIIFLIFFVIVGGSILIALNQQYENCKLYLDDPKVCEVIYRW